jgi:hypothetical protein
MANEIAERYKRDAPSFGSSQRLDFGRQLWVRVHRYIGLFLGGLFVVVGLTGSILAYWQAIDEWLNKDIMRTAAPAGVISYRPLDEILAAANAAAPQGGMPQALRMPRHASAAAAIFYIVPSDDGTADYHEIFVDPYTARVTGKRLAMRADRLLTTRLLSSVFQRYFFSFRCFLGFIFGGPALAAGAMRCWSNGAQPRCG